MSVFVGVDASNRKVVERGRIELTFVLSASTLRANYSPIPVVGLLGTLHLEYQGARTSCLKDGEHTL